MIFVIAIIIVLLGSAVVAVFAMEDPGYIMLTFHDWTIETSFVMFAVVMFISFIVLTSHTIQPLGNIVIINSSLVMVKTIISIINFC